ncbi:hypothetical protein P2H44_22800 [Albimonas sp. CAU 1670]|uniref:hypothetical protein n=1 Tax=Albimonas sp. CAU 1670 TaxID=3032599 RepID=UPI0023DCE98C|nr:hypothetical protein [Albimonas sp. CAU 1670]MDF2235395.1 hypothetical protein [Albimonas sp. CAU 1670]
MPAPVPPPLPPISDEVLDQLADVADQVLERRASAEGVALLCLCAPAALRELQARRAEAARIRTVADRLASRRERSRTPLPDLARANVITLAPPLSPSTKMLGEG